MIDFCSQETKPLLLVEDAIASIQASVTRINAQEVVDLKSALGRVLAEDIYANVPSPPYKNSAMDGYAFFSKDIDGESAFILKRVGTSWAGRPYTGKVEPGQCVRIFTGAVVPAGLDSVIMQEQVTVNDELIHFPASVQPYQNIRNMGEDVEQGAQVLAANKALNAMDLGLLASVGVETLAVNCRVKVAIFSTGDELQSLGQPLGLGQIYDSNRYTLNALLSDPLYQVTDMGVLLDDPDLLEASFIKAAQDYDVIISTGGASVGDADYIKEILTRCGQVSFWKLAIKPGKPLAYGKIGDCHFFGLPGNPVAVVVTFQYLVEPALKKLAGGVQSKKLQITATSLSVLKKSAGRQEYLRGILIQDSNGEFFVSSAGKQGSHILTSMSQANCYIVLPVACQGVKEGDKVNVDIMPGASIV